MKVSIVMPVFNCEDYILSSIRSVQAQTHKDWELICVDDGSTDNSVKYASDISKLDQRVKVCSLPKNKGAAVARNKGISLASGEYIAFLDADDWWGAEKLEKQVKVLRDPEIDFVCTAYDAIDFNGKVHYRVVPPKLINFNSLLKTSKIGCSSVMLRKGAIEGFELPNLRKRQDYAFWLLLTRNGKCFQGLQEVLTHYRLRKDSLSAKKSGVLQYQWSVYRQVLGLSIVESCFYFTFYAVNGILRRAYAKL